MELTRRKSVVLLSGGLDSAANLAFARWFDLPVLALTVDYGQKAAVPEIQAAKKFADYYEVPHQVLDLKWLGALGGSALTATQQEIPRIETNRLDDLKSASASAKAVWVPNRNGLFINAAAAIAESMGAAQIVVGFNQEEAATFPDNSSQYLGVATLALRYSTGTGVKVGCYTEMMNKKEMVQALKNLSQQPSGKRFPFEWVWSCYRGGPQKCGECESCKRFERALLGEASVKK